MSASQFTLSIHGGVDGGLTKIYGWIGEVNGRKFLGIIAQDDECDRSANLYLSIAQTRELKVVIDKFLAGDGESVEPKVEGAAV